MSSFNYVLNIQACNLFYPLIYLVYKMIKRRALCKDSAVNSHVFHQERFTGQLCLFNAHQLFDEYEINVLPVKIYTSV